MKIRIASLLLALALPLAAQEPVAAETEAMFYKAFYLEKGQRDFAGAMTLYEQFLAKAPEHKLAAEAAKQQFNLLNATGKTKERDAFKAKYEKLLGNVATAPVAGAGGAEPRTGRGQGGEGRGEGPGAGGAGRPDMAARIAELEKQLEKAKADGNAEEVKRLEQQLERARQGGRGQGGPGGAGGQGGRRGGAMGLLMGNKKVADMTAEEITQLKEGLAGTTRMIDMMKQNGQEEQAKKLEGNVDALKKALDANKTEDAQKAMDAIRESMPRRGRGGDAGGAGGAGAGGGGNRGGGGGNNGGGGGGGNGGGGGR